VISTERAIKLRDRYTGGKDLLRHAPEEIIRTGREMAEILDIRTAEEFSTSHDFVLTRTEDGWIVVECPELPGCVSQGKDEAEALANIREALAGWPWAEEQKKAEAQP